MSSLLHYGLAIVLSAAGLLLYTPSVSAHVHITDTTKEIGAILHIQPDDDPVAGESSHIYYDIQNQSLMSERSNIRLAVKSDEGSTDVPITVNNNGINADYTFPTIGAYTLILSVNAPTGTYSFEHTQRISRGVSSSPLDAPTYEWAEILLIATIVGIVGVCIAVFNQRNAIKAYSRF